MVAGGASYGQQVERDDAIEGLAPVYREAVRLCDAGLDAGGIADQLSLTPESVPALLDIAEAKLARLLREDAP